MEIVLSVYEPPLNVTREPGSLVRFFVRSQDRRKKNEHYLVDLEEPEFPRGWCECLHYDFRIEPKLKRGRKAAGDGICKHIKRVLSVLEMCALICESHGEETTLAPRRVPDIWEYEHTTKIRRGVSPAR